MRQGKSGIGLSRKEKIWFLMMSISVLVLIIAVNSLANFLGLPVYYVFYQGFYGLLLSTLFPLYYVFRYEKAGFAELGFSRITVRAVLVAVLFIAFSIGGQIYKRGLSLPSLEQMVYITVPLIMTTFFEEFLFRGFIQTRLEKVVGAIPAIVLSALFFSLYHLGYPLMRNGEMLLTLFCVGIMFALSYKLSKNNLFTAYIVNLPNAVLTYIYDPDYFMEFKAETAIVSIITMVLVLVLLLFFRNKLKKEKLGVNLAMGG